METKLFFSLLFHWILLISVDDSPFLISGSLLRSNSHILSFSIFICINLHYFTFDVDKHVSSVSEQLVPLTCGGPHINLILIEVQWFSSSNIDYCSALVIKHPLLCFLATPLINHDVVFSDIEISLAGHLGNNRKFFSNIHSPISPPFSIFQRSFKRVQVDNIPLLI